MGEGTGRVWSENSKLLFSRFIGRARRLSTGVFLPGAPPTRPRPRDLPSHRPLTPATPPVHLHTPYAHRSRAGAGPRRMSLHGMQEVQLVSSCRGCDIQLQRPVSGSRISRSSISKDTSQCIRCIVPKWVVRLCAGQTRLSTRACARRPRFPRYVSTLPAPSGFRQSDSRAVSPCHWYTGGLTEVQLLCSRASSCLPCTDTYCSRPSVWGDALSPPFCGPPASGSECGPSLETTGFVQGTRHGLSGSENEKHGQPIAAGPKPAPELNHSITQSILPRGRARPASRRYGTFA